MATTNATQVRSVFHDGKERKIKRIDLHPGEDIQYTKALTRLSTHTRYSLTFGILIVTDQRVLFSPAGYTRRVPAKTWSADLDAIESIHCERKQFNVKDLAVGLFMHPVAKLSRRFIKTLCIETADGRKQYFTIESQFSRSVHLNHLRKHKVEQVVDELRNETGADCTSPATRPMSEEERKQELINSDSEHPVATAIVVHSESVLPAEKDTVRQHLLHQSVATGQVLNVDGAEIAVISTKPTTGTAFGAHKATVVKQTRIRFD